MFGQAPPALGKTADWLRELRAVDADTRAGELMHRNLLEDENVCAEYRERTLRFLESHLATDPPNGQATYEALCDHLKTIGCRYCDGPNEGNRLSANAFGGFARVVNAVTFATHNVTPKVKNLRWTPLSRPQNVIS